MPTPIPPSTSPQTPVTTNAPSVESAAPAVTPEKPQPQTPKEDPKAAAKNAEASKQHAMDKMRENDRQGQVVKNQLVNIVPGKDKNAGSGQTAKGATTSSEPPKASKTGSAYDWEDLRRDVGHATVGAAKTSKTEKATSPEKPAQQKKTGKPSEGNVWESVKGAVRYTADVANAGVGMLREGTAAAAAADASEKAAQVAAKELAERNKRGAELASEVKRVGSGNASFQEKEQLIQKIDAHRREGNMDDVVSPLYNQETQKAPRMEERPILPGSSIKVKVPLPKIAQTDPSDNLTGGLTELLGPYGYSMITATSDKPGEGRGTRQGEVLDTALHNWRVTSPKDRFTIHTRGGGADIPHKDWKTPADIRQQNREAEANQVVLNPPTKGAYMEVPVARPRANQPDPEQVEAQGRYNLGNATIDLINTVGGGLAAKAGRGSASKNLGTRGTTPEWNAPGQSESSNIGNAKTQQAPVQPAPAEPPQNQPVQTQPDGLAGRARVNTAPDGLAGKASRKLQDAKRDIVAERKRVAAEAHKYTPTGKARPGEGKDVNVDATLDQMELKKKKSGNTFGFSESLSSEQHRIVWEKNLGKKLGKNEDPPIVFTIGENVRIDITRLTPEQLRRYRAIHGLPE